MSKHNIPRGYFSDAFYRRRLNNLGLIALYKGATAGRPATGVVGGGGEGRAPLCARPPPEPLTPP